MDIHLTDLLKISYFLLNDTRAEPISYIHGVIRKFVLPFFQIIPLIKSPIQFWKPLEA